MTEKLFKDFPPVPTQQWEEQIEKDLKGADYEKKLVWKIPDGVAVRPYYRAEDLEGLPYIDSLPGEKPYLRGTKTDNNWLVRQTFAMTDHLKEVNALVLEALSRGVESVGFRTDAGRKLTKQDMAVLLDQVPLTTVELAFSGASCTNPHVLYAFLEYVKEQGTEANGLRVRFEFDPLGDAFFNGIQAGKEVLDAWKELVKASRPYPGIRVVSVPGYQWQNMGSGIVQELGCSLALGKEYINLLTEDGMSPEEAAGSIHFHMGIGLQYFLEIAKFRALRVLWDGICGLPASVHATTGFWDQTAYDMYVNLLRGTTGAMSAAIAGVDSLEVLPFDCVLSEGTPHSYRLARNIQIILKEEAGFHKVTDPAAGSYYVESITDSVQKEAQKLADEILAKGGFSNKQAAEWVREQIKATRQRRLERLASGREVMVGINKYPDPLGKAPEGLATLPEEKWERASAEFERMRLKTEQAKETPVVFLLTFGNLGMCRARAQFATNFFGVAGFKIIDNNRFASVEEGIQAARKQGAHVVVACSSDEEYAQGVPQIARALGKEAIVTVAGEPACKEDLKAQGVNHFISVRSNLLETLLQYQNELGL
ncbi:MAG: methylmalonyl-CoA mutase small subunit [Bacteroidales bacterium]|nr:methylmalonyl-CoA mutase small subunit [Bacteroidales bacterium]